MCDWSGLCVIGIGYIAQGYEVYKLKSSLVHKLGLAGGMMGHTFYLGTKYSDTLRLRVAGADPVTGKRIDRAVEMGCYWDQSFFFFFSAD